MKGKVLIVQIIVLATCFIAYDVIRRTPPEKVGYVRTRDLLENFKGLEEARLIYDQKKENWTANLDSLKMDLNKTVSLVNEQTDPGLKQNAYLTLQHQQKNLTQYAALLDEKAAEEDARLTAGVIKQINEFIEDYGKEHGYTLILGITESGNILYGDQPHDVTEEILTALNKHYLDQN